jgi:hypothetical protein
MRQTTRELEQEIAAVRREIDGAVPALDGADKTLERWACEQGGTELEERWDYVFENRRQVLSPLFARLHALEARLPDKATTRPETFEALLCLMDHEEAPAAANRRRGVTSLAAAWTEG